MPHEFRGLVSASHETLGTTLLARGVAAIILLVMTGCLPWRNKKLNKPGPQHESSLPAPERNADDDSEARLLNAQTVPTK